MPVSLPLRPCPLAAETDASVDGATEEAVAVAGAVALAVAEQAEASPEANGYSDENEGRPWPRPCRNEPEVHPAFGTPTSALAAFATRAQGHVHGRARSLLQPEAKSSHSFACSRVAEARAEGAGAASPASSDNGARPDAARGRGGAHARVPLCVA